MNFWLGVGCYFLGFLTYLLGYAVYTAYTEDRR